MDVGPHCVLRYILASCADTLGTGVELLDSLRFSASKDFRAAVS